MKHYSKKRKDAVLKRMMQPENAAVPLLAEETAVMNQAELSQYCRKKGLFAEQITVWKENCLQGNAAAVNQSKEEKRQALLVRNEVKELKRELRRKDQALAETAALLVLRKKMHAIWGEDEDE
jgi:transposase